MTVLLPARAGDRREHAGESPRQVPRPRLALGALAVVVASFAAFSASRMLPPQPYGLADDWRVFYAAAAVIAHGGNPYDAALIHPAEQRAERYAQVQPSLDDYVDLPVVAWTLQPFAALPFWPSYALAMLIGAAAAAMLLMIWLRRLGWRRGGRWTLLALLSWPALLGVYSGQFDLALLAAVLGGMLLARGRPGTAGALCAAAALVKPHILWPLPLLLAASQLPDRRAAARAMLASAAVAVAAVGGGELLMPGTTRAFLSHLLAFGGRISAVQPDLAGIPGMVEHLPAGGAIATAVSVAGVAGTLAFTAWWAMSRPARRLDPVARTAIGVCAGLALWLVATPYAHPNDDVLLFPLLALLVGPDAVRVPHRELVAAMLGCAGLIAAFVVAVPAGVAVAVLLGAALWQRAGRGGAEPVAAAGLVALATLPMVWPFHVLPVSLTPLAVLVVAAGGVALVRRATTVRAGCCRAFAPAG